MTAPWQLHVLVFKIRSNHVCVVLHVFVDYTLRAQHITNTVIPQCFYHLFESHAEEEHVLQIMVWLCIIISIVLFQVITLNHTLQKYLKHVCLNKQWNNQCFFFYYYSKCLHTWSKQLFLVTCACFLSKTQQK